MFLIYFIMIRILIINIKILKNLAKDYNIEIAKKYNNFARIIFICKFFSKI